MKLTSLMPVSFIIKSSTFIEVYLEAIKIVNRPLDAKYPWYIFDANQLK